MSDLRLLSQCESRAALFWDFTLCRMVVPYRRFGTNYQSCLQGSSMEPWGCP